METEIQKFNFVDTTARKKIWALRKRIRAVKGGTSASKTITILCWLIDFCQQKFQSPEISTVGSETYPHLEGGAIRDFKAIMKDRGYWKDFLWNETKHFYTFETGNIIEFVSIDTYSKAHGPRRKNLFLNECNNLPWLTVDQMMVRTSGVIWLDWNPVSEFWFHTEILPYRDDVDYITLTYKDNEGLSDIIVKDIESHQHNIQWWKVYGLGEDGTIEGRIYPDWEQIDEIPKEARKVRSGLDFGFSNDPTALYDIYEWNKCFIVDEILYQKGLFNNEIGNKIGRNQPLCVADCAEPKSIAEIAMMGVNIIGSKKGKGSINHGINSVRSRKILITKRSVHGIKEQRNYCYIKNVDGTYTNEPQDFGNHAMDAIRYAIADLIPDAEEQDAYIPEVPYQTPGLGSSKLETTPTPILTIQGPSKNRLAFLQERKRERGSSYESDTPYESPGLPR